MSFLLYHGDCLDFLSQIETSTVDLVFTDPPYNIATKRKFTRGTELKPEKTVSMDFGDWDMRSRSDFLKWSKTWIDECKRVLKPNGNLVIWQSKHCLLNPVVEQYNEDADEVEWELRQVFTWCKTNPVPQFQKVNFLSGTEFMSWFTKSGTSRKDQIFNFKNQNEMLNWRSRSIVMGNERLGHPTQKPLDLTKHLIEIFSNEGSVVCDPFFGVGTTAVAAKITNRNFIGGELDIDYYTKAVKRVNDARA